MSKVFLSLINIYQQFLSFDGGALSFLAPGGACKYKFRGELSCSQYMKEQIKERGAMEGVLFGMRRIWSCK